MKQNLSSYFDLRSARNSDSTYQRLINDSKENRNGNRQLLSAVSEKIFIGQQTPGSDYQFQENNDRNEKSPISSSKYNTLAPFSNTNTDQQQLHQFLTSDGESERNNNYDIILSTGGRHNPQIRENGTMVNTNKSSSSFKNPPMSYSSTQSKSYLNDKFQKIQDLRSPEQEDDYSKEESKYFSERQPRFSENGMPMQSSNKKSVKFMDEYNESRFFRQNDGSILFSGTENILNSNSKNYDVDSSQIIQTRIDQRVNEINKRYFSNEPKPDQNNDKKLKPIIKILDSSLQRSGNEKNVLSDTKKSALSEDDVNNSIVAMEEEIESHKHQFRNKIDKQYFSQEPSIVIQSKKNQPSVFTSTNSFEQLRDEILNHQSLNKGQIQESGTVNKSLQMILQDNYNSNDLTKQLGFYQGNTMGLTFDKESAVKDLVNKSESQNQNSALMNNYMPLRKSREVSLNISDSKRKPRHLDLNNQKPQESYREYAQQLQNDNYQFESKLQSLKSKINNIHQQSMVQPNMLSRQDLQSLNTIGNTPTMQDLNTESKHSQDKKYEENHYPQYKQDILILQPANEYQTSLSSKTSSRGRSSMSREQNMNTRDLRSKIMELKQSISDNEGEEVSFKKQNLSQQITSAREQKGFSTIQSRNNNHNVNRSGSIKNGTINITTFGNETISSKQRSAQRNKVSHDFKKRSNSRTMDQSRDAQEQMDSVSKLKKKIQWLEKRNLEYSQRMKDLNSEKNQAQSQIQDLQKQVKEMSQRLNFNQHDLKSVQRTEHKKIQMLQQQLQEVQQLIQRNSQKDQDKENVNILNQTSQNITTISEIQKPEEQNAPRLQALRVNHYLTNQKKAPLVPLRQSKHHCDNVDNKTDSLTNRNKSRSCSKTRPKFDNIRIRQVSKDLIAQQKPSQIKKKGKSKSKSRERKSKKNKMLVHQLTKQVCGLQKQIEDLMQQKNQQKEQEKFGIIEKITDHIQSLRNPKEVDQILDQLTEVLQRDEEQKENIDNNLKENKFKRDKRDLSNE